MYVSVGSLGNVDPDSSRARINRYNISNNGSFPIHWNDGELFADGLRNEVGLAWDLNGVLHGVENCADNLFRDDLGGDIHNGNPAEEMNRFDQPVGSNYGYPHCWSSRDLEGYPRGTQFAWPTFMNDGVHDDAWCQNTTNNKPPLIAMPAHNAPLGMDFYTGQGCEGGNGAFPCNMTGDGFVAFHGSWNSDIPVGYRVAWYPFDSQGQPTMDDLNVVYENNVTRCYSESCFRPVNIVFNARGHAFISDDQNGQILRITYGMAL
jgi:glucose/arabinose dehydrogenase